MTQLLLIEGVEHIRVRLHDLLMDSHENLLIKIANNYNSAVQSFNKHQPEIIVLDMNLPNEESFKILHFVKSVSKPVIVVAMSIYNDPLFLKRLETMQVDYFVDKYDVSENMPCVMMKIGNEIYAD